MASSESRVVLINTDHLGLSRRLGVGTATTLVVANMIGTGVFTTTGLMLARLGSGWLVLLCWWAAEMEFVDYNVCLAEAFLRPQYEIRRDGGVLLRIYKLTAERRVSVIRNASPPPRQFSVARPP